MSFFPRICKKPESGSVMHDKNSDIRNAAVGCFKSIETLRNIVGTSVLSLIPSQWAK
jgi:hypothetical protein